MYNIAQKLKECIAMQKKIDNDTKTRKFFSGAGLTIEVYKGGDSTREPDYCIETSSPELSEELMGLLSKINVSKSLDRREFPPSTAYQNSLALVSLPSCGVRFAHTSQSSCEPTNDTQVSFASRLSSLDRREWRSPSVISNQQSVICTQYSVLRTSL